MTRIAFLPPISSATRLWPAAASMATWSPVAVEPVNEMSATFEWRTSAAPSSGLLPRTKFTTPGGTPHSSRTWTKSEAVTGVSGDGFSTTVLPRISAGKVFQEGMAMGKFHGVIKPTTPTGSRTHRADLSGSSDGTTRPNWRRPSAPM